MPFQNIDKKWKFSVPLISALLIYLPQFVFNILAPVIIFRASTPEELMLVFYAATFGVGILSSGFGNTTHFLQQKTENKNTIMEFVGIYVLVRLITIAIIVFSSLEFNFLDVSYQSSFLIALILASLPGWNFLYFLGMEKFPIILAWVEFLTKTLMISLSVEMNLPIWYFLIFPALTNLVIGTYFLIKINIFHKSPYITFFKNHLLFISNGIFFSLSWLIFMSMILNVNTAISSSVIVFLERILRVFERLSSVLATIFFRKTKKNINENIRVTILNFNKKFLPYFLIAFMVNFYLIDTLYMIFIVSIFNVIWGQFAQQIIRPNVIYNIGGVAQALFLIIPYYFMEFSSDELFVMFLVGCVINFLIRRKSLMWSKNGTS